MRFFLDSEFMEDGHTIEPLSIGIVSELFHKLYVVITDADLDRANDFVRAEVLPHLRATPPAGTETVFCTKAGAKHWIMDWLQRVLPDGDTPEFWADYGAYDWVLFCQLWGNMTDLPEGFPMFIRDVEQLRHDIGWDGPFPHEEMRNFRDEPAHNAVHDAFETFERWAFLVALVEARDTELTPEAFVQADLDASRDKHPSNGPPPKFPGDGSMETAP